MDSDTLFKKWGFIKHPFKVFDAEDEQNLQQFFIEPPYFKEILGDSEKPNSTMVFGYRGEGKSTLCKMIDYELRNNTSNRILIVPYYDFSCWGEKRIKELSLDDHLERILGLCVETLIAEVEKDTRILETLQSRDRSILQWFVLRFLPETEYQQVEYRLIALFDRLPQSGQIKRYGGMGLRRIRSYLRRKKVEFERIPKSESKIVQIIAAILAILGSSIPGSETLRNETMLGLLKRLRNLVITAGFTYICILVDKVDESEACSGNRRNVARLISPMVSSLDYLRTKKVATKFFLPFEVKEILGNQVRTDKTRTRTINWSKENLAAMLRKRLLSFSNNKIQTLEPFVDTTLWQVFEQKLYYYSALCPRNLIRIMDHIIAELCELEQDPSKITKSAMELGIQHFLSIRMGEEDAGEYQNRLREK